MTRIEASRVRILRAALREAVAIGDRNAAKRLTAKLAKILGTRPEAIPSPIIH